MPRPQPKTITFTIDGREVQAAENTMLVDAAKHGDVEIPVFCYEPKLGAPVGACRMCLVEIEGIPKLQTGCSTPVKDGMVVNTQTERVKEAQQAVVEFLLINHPLDCPVCDKGGECPLQDISFGWGGGQSRFIEPKRHFTKPLALSPLIAIDRERCILCYRCVRFSQEVSEDYQLVLQERGADSFVSTFDGHPYVAPFSGNIIELCPVGALTSQPYRFRARPWDIEGSGSVCSGCSAQCNVEYTVRDDRVLRVLGRDHAGVDDGWLCDKGRFAYQSFHVDERITQPLLRDGGELRPVPWERALDEAAKALSRAKGSVGAIAGGPTSNEEGFLLARLLREGLDSHDIDSRGGGSLPRELHAALHAPARQASVPDLEFAHAVLVIDCEPVDDAPVIDLRIRKGVRRNKVKLAVATPRPSSLDPNAHATARFAPGAGEAFCAALSAALGDGKNLDELAAAAGTPAEDIRALATLLGDAGKDVVVLWGERLTHGPRGDHAARALLNVAGRLIGDGHAGAGLLELPASPNGRGLREAGVLPGIGPGLTEAGEGRDTLGIRDALAAGELTALYLLHVDPMRSLPGRPEWDAALERATTVVAHASFLTDGLREHATVVFPAESAAEKEGTLTHPDSRVQRMRPAVGRAGETRATWQVISDLARMAGHDLQILTGAMASAQLFAAVPFYGGLTLDLIGGRGIRWTDRETASEWPDADAGPFGLEVPPHPPTPNGELRLGTYRSIWAHPDVEHAPALKFLRARQHAELNPADAERLGLEHGDRVLVGPDDGAINAVVTLRDAAPQGTVFVQTGIEEDAADALAPGLVQVRPAEILVEDPA